MEHEQNTTYVSGDVTEDAVRADGPLRTQSKSSPARRCR